MIFLFFTFLNPKAFVKYPDISFRTDTDLLFSNTLGFRTFNKAIITIRVRISVLEELFTFVTEFSC